MQDQLGSFYNLTSDPRESGAARYAVTRSAQVGSGAFAVLEGAWTARTRSEWETSGYVIEMPLSRRPAGAHAVHVGLHRPVEAYLDRTLVIPPGSRVLSTSERGRHRGLTGFLAESAIEEALDGRANWRRDALAQALDLHCPAIDRILRDIYRELCSPGFASRLLLESHATALAVAIIRRFGLDRREGMHSRGGLSPHLLRRIEARVRDGQSLPTLAGLARDCGYSVRHLSRAFKEATGTTVAAFIRDEQTARAAGLLRESDMTIGEVAAAAGFSSGAAFATAFRRETGLAPGEWRRGAAPGRESSAQETE